MVLRGISYLAVDRILNRVVVIVVVEYHISSLDHRILSLVMYHMVNVFHAVEHLMDTMAYHQLNLYQNLVLMDCTLSDFLVGNFLLCVLQLDYLFERYFKFR